MARAIDAATAATPSPRKTPQKPGRRPIDAFESRPGETGRVSESARPGETARVGETAGSGESARPGEAAKPGEESGAAILFITAGGNRVDDAKASALAGEPLGKADAGLIRTQTGFAIGGVSPLGASSKLSTLMDEDLFQHATVWAAAGTPRHVFEVVPLQLRSATGASVGRVT